MEVLFLIGMLSCFFIVMRLLLRKVFMCRYNNKEDD